MPAISPKAGMLQAHGFRKVNPEQGQSRCKQPILSASGLAFRAILKAFVEQCFVSPRLQRIASWLWPRVAFTPVPGGDAAKRALAAFQIVPQRPFPAIECGFGDVLVCRHGLETRCRLLAHGRGILRLQRPCPYGRRHAVSQTVAAFARPARWRRVQASARPCQMLL